MDEERRKRVRSDQGDQDNNKNTKLAKRPQSEQSLYDHHHRRHSEASDGVFDFPWLKDGVGISRSEEWKLEEDSLVTQLRDWIISNNADEYSTITTATGIEFSFSKQLLLPDQMIIGDLDPNFPDEMFGCLDELSTSSSLIEEYFGSNLDCIWTAFA